MFRGRQGDRPLGRSELRRAPPHGGPPAGRNDPPGRSGDPAGHPRRRDRTVDRAEDAGEGGGDEEGKNRRDGAAFERNVRGRRLPRPQEITRGAQPREPRDAKTSAAQSHPPARARATAQAEAGEVDAEINTRELATRTFA